MRRPIVVRYRSTKTPKAVYDVYIKDLQTAIKLSWNDANSLGDIEEDLRNCLADIQNQRYRLKQNSWTKERYSAPPQP